MDSIHSMTCVVEYKFPSMNQLLMMYGSAMVPVPLRTPFAEVKSAFDPM